MSGAVVVGLDAGGTTTRATALSLDGRRLGTGRAGGGNPTSHGIDNALGEIRSALRAALDGLDPARIQAGAIGLAGAGRVLTDSAGRTALDQTWHEVGLHCDLPAARGGTRPVRTPGDHCRPGQRAGGDRTPRPGRPAARRDDGANPTGRGPHPRGARRRPPRRRHPTRGRGTERSVPQVAVSPGVPGRRRCAAAAWLAALGLPDTGDPAALHTRLVLRCPGHPLASALS